MSWPHRKRRPFKPLILGDNVYPITRPSNDPETSTEPGSFSNDPVDAFPHVDEGAGCRGYLLEGPPYELGVLLGASTGSLLDWNGPWPVTEGKGRAVVWHRGLNSSDDDLREELRRASDIASVDVVFRT